MVDAAWVMWGLPLVGIAFGGVAYLWLRHKTDAFDRRYGHRPTLGE